VGAPRAAAARSPPPGLPPRGRGRGGWARGGVARTWPGGCGRRRCPSSPRSPGGWATREASKTLTVPPNAGKPHVVRELQDGWVESSFAEFPLTVELPGEAESLPFKSEDLGPEFKIIADHFVSYSASGEEANAYLFGYWMNLIGMATISDSEIRAFATEFSAEEGTTKIIELPGVPRDVLATYYFSKQEGVDAHTVNLFRKFEHGLLVVSIAALTESAARETGMRIGKTIKL